MKKLMLMVVLGLSFITIRPAYGFILAPPPGFTNMTKVELAQYYAAQSVIEQKSMAQRNAAYQEGVLAEQGREIARLEYSVYILVVMFIGLVGYLLFRPKLISLIRLIGIGQEPDPQAKPPELHDHPEHPGLIPTAT